MIAEVEAGNVGAVIVKDTASIYTPDPVWKRKLDKLVEKNPQCYQCVKADEVSKTYSNRILRSRKPHKVLGYAYPLFVPSALFKVGKED